MNKMSVTSWENQAAIDTSKVEEGSFLYLQDKKGWFGVKSISPLTLVSVGGGSLSEYPNHSWKEAFDHFTNREFPNALINTSAVLYDAMFNASNIWSHASAENNEFLRHAIKQTNGLATGGQGGKYAKGVSVFHTKDDIDLAATKVTVEIRFKLGLRVSSFKHYFGLVDPEADANLTGTRKAVFAEVNGNFLLRTSDGSESDLNSGTVGDTSVHKHKFTWTSSQLEYFIDGVSKGTKTTNRPDRAMAISFFNRNDSGSTQTSNDIVDYWHIKME
jgi:hypothetical protein